MEGLVAKVFEGLTSQCGIAGATFLVGWGIAMWQLSKERAGRENDRERAMEVADKQATAHMELKHALSEIHGFMMAAFGSRNMRSE